MELCSLTAVGLKVWPMETSPVFLTVNATILLSLPHTLTHTPSHPHTHTPSPAIVGHCDLSSPNVEEILSRHCQSKRFRGIRQNILNFDTDKFAVCEPHNAHLLDDPRWLEGLAQLERRGLCFELHLLAQHMHKYVGLQYTYVCTCKYSR